MNGTSLFRRSLSIVLASSSLVVAGCGVELGGLFDGDGGTEDVAPRDGARDANATSDRAADSKVDTSADGGAPDNVSPPDTSSGDVGRDVTIDPRVDIGGGDDPIVGVPDTADGVVTVDIRADADATIDVSLDADGSADMGTEPPLDALAEDSSADPRFDVSSDPIVDAVTDARDVTVDRGDAAPPGICMSPCNDFADIGQTLTRTVVPGPPPTMTGGPILDGTYVATSVVQYNGDNQMFTLSETSIISGNVDAWVSTTNGAAPIRYTTTFTVALNQIAFTFCCPGTGALTITYTTNGSTLSHVDPANPNRVITYTRQ